MRDAFIGESSPRYLRVVIGSTVITPVNVSCDAAEDYQRWSLTIKNRAELTVGLYANEAVTVDISADGSTWYTIFTGYCSDDGLGRSRGLVTDDYVTLTLVDATKRKGTKRKPTSVLLSGMDISDTVNTGDSILHYLASKMGVTVEASAIAYTKDLVQLGSSTVWAELQSLAEAFHADMYFRYDGKLLFHTPFDTGYSAPTSEWLFQGDPANSVTGASSWIKGKVEEVYKPILCNKATGVYDDYEELSSRIIYKNTEEYDDATDTIEITLAAGAYWPGPASTDVASLEYKDPDNDEKYPFAKSVVTPTLGAYGSDSDIESTGGTLSLVSFNGSTSATSLVAGTSQIILHNSGEDECRIRKLTVRGVPYRQVSKNTVEFVDATITDEVDYVEDDVDGRFATSTEQIYDTLQMVVNEGKGRPRVFAISAPFMPWIQRRAVVQVQPPGEDAVSCRVNTYSHKNKARTLQGMVTSLVCTETSSFSPSGEVVVVTTPMPAPVPPVGASAKSVAISATRQTINTSSRGVIYGTDISLVATLQGLTGTPVWSVEVGTGTLVAGASDYEKTLDISTVTSDSITIGVTVGLYSALVGIVKVADGVPAPCNFGGVTAVPTETPDGDPLVAGDYFLWATTTGGGHTKGVIYEYSGTAWAESTNGDLVMTLFDSFADLANDVDSTVIGNAVIKKLVALDAIVKNLLAENLKAGAGDGTASSGFRFRAQTDSAGDGTDVPVFDVYKDDKQLFKVDISTGKIYFGEHFWYDPSDGKIHTKDDKILIGSDGKMNATDLVVDSIKSSRSGVTLTKTMSGTAGSTVEWFDASGIGMLEYYCIGADAGTVTMVLAVSWDGGTSWSTMDTVAQTGAGWSTVKHMAFCTGSAYLKFSTTWSGSNTKSGVFKWRTF